MAVKDDIAKIVVQEKTLVFPAFDEQTAFEVGSALRELGLADALPMVIDVRFWDRPLFYAALPGSTAGNFNWARRKINAVRAYQKSTYRMFLEQGADARIFGPDHGLDPANYAIAGGAFPIRVKGVGVVGVVAVSGLPQRDDHNLVVRGLCRHLHVDEAELSLAPEA